jgi:ATP-binding cassette, subfamily B, bacterial
MLGHFAHLSYFELGEIDEMTLNRRLLRIINGSRGAEQYDDKAFADGVDLLRQDIVRMREMIHSAIQLACLSIQVAVTAFILAAVQPWLLFLPVAAVVPVVVGHRAERIVEDARERVAPINRGIRHLRTLASDPRTQKDIRVSGAAHYLVARQDALQHATARVLGRAQVRWAAAQAAGQVFFGLAYAASVVVGYVLALHGRASVGDVVLVVTLATQTTGQVHSGLGLLDHVHRAAVGLGRFETLRAASVSPVASAATTGGADPEVSELRDGITFESVSFTYPGSDAVVLRDFGVHLPAGRTVALVGENGAGKSTLIKLLCGLYLPTSGRILVDGVDIASIDPTSWRARTATLFQDFAHFEFTLQESIGVGRLADIDSAPAVVDAIGRARATGLLDRVEGRLDALVGHGYGDGIELSGGQWQNVGLARALMRTSPLLLALDEPGSALDPFAEQRVCDAYQEVARDVAMRVGGVTIYVTHRLSTVKLADIILVLQGGRLVEAGSHDSLTALGGRYAELFALQSRAYVR